MTGTLKCGEVILMLKLLMWEKSLGQNLQVLSEVEVHCTLERESGPVWGSLPWGEISAWDELGIMASTPVGKRDSMQPDLQTPTQMMRN